MKRRINQHRDDIMEYLDDPKIKEIFAVPESHGLTTMVAQSDDGSELLLVARDAGGEFTTRMSVHSYPEAMVVARAIIEAAGVAWPDGEAEMAESRAKNPGPREC